jgi:hypothetical protein
VGQGSAIAKSSLCRWSIIMITSKTINQRGRLIAANFCKYQL